MGFARPMDIADRLRPAGHYRVLAQQADARMDIVVQRLRLDHAGDIAGAFLSSVDSTRICLVRPDRRRFVADRDRAGRGIFHLALPAGCGLRAGHPLRRQGHQLDETPVAVKDLDWDRQYQKQMQGADYRQ